MTWILPKLRRSAPAPRGLGNGARGAPSTRVLGAVAAAGLLAGGTAHAHLAHATSQATAYRATASASPAHPVVMIGVAGLRWTDVSPAATPALWRLAEDGSVGTLVVRAVLPRGCPTDGWLTLNAGARAMARHLNKGPCPPVPTPLRMSGSGSSPAADTPAPASLPELPSMISYNQRFHYNPRWGLLASAAGPGGCVTAIGPGAAVALADSSGRVASYLPSVAVANRSALSRCPLTMLDLGAIPDASASGGAPARTAAVRAADQAVARLTASIPPSAILTLAAPADDASPHLRVIVVSGPGYAAGTLATASTRQPGMVQLTDLTAAILTWRGQRIPAGVVGSPLTRADRGGLAAAIRGLVGEDTAAQVYRSTFGWFFAVFVVSEVLVFAGIGLLLWGRDETRRRRRAKLWRFAGVFAGAVPAGTFLTSVTGWWTLSHPAIWLYSLSAAWAIVIAAGALAGPWRRDPFGPPGFVAVITVAVIGLDVMTGSRLQLGTPFGLSALEAGRFYGVGNNALGPYGTAGMLSAAWLGGMTLRRGTRRHAVLAVAAVAAFAVVASGWPGFGSKFGGTVAMVPGFILLGLYVGGIGVTVRRGLLIGVSGVAAVTAFGLINYFVPMTGHSHIGEFVGQVLHGGAGGVLQRKISSNIGSLTITTYSPLVPVIVVLLGLVLLRPSWFAARSLALAQRRLPLLGRTLAAIWVVAVLGWFVDDSGVTVAAAALPMALPLAIAIVSAASFPDLAGDGHRPRDATVSPSPSVSSGAPASVTDAATSKGPPRKGRAF